MRRSVLSEYVELKAEFEQQTSERYVDLSIRLVVADVDTTGTWPVFIKGTDEVLVELGGRWDRKLRKWAKHDSRRRWSGVVVRVPRGSDQEKPARYLAQFFLLYALGPRGTHWTRAQLEDGFKRAYTLILVGGRRAGKSKLAIAAKVMFCVAFKSSIGWAISPTSDRNEEVLTELGEALARTWYRKATSKTDKTTTFTLVNGSKIRCISGYKPSALRQGRCDIALYNEAQDMSKAGWKRLRGAIADRGGMVILACNPPDAEIGRWVEDLYDRARSGKVDALAAYDFTAEGNPFADFEVLKAMKLEDDDPLEYEREVLGKFVPIGTVCYHSWSDSASVLKEVPSDWIEITAEVTKAELGAPAFAVVGMDFQYTPHMVGIPRRYFRSPATPEDVLEVIVDEIVVGNASEDDLVDGLEAKRPGILEGRWERTGRVAGVGYEGATTAVVMDASGFHQDGAHNQGKTSDEALKRRGWRRLYKPQKDSDRNPDIKERKKWVNARLKNAAGRRRLFVLSHCVQVIKSMRSMELVDGNPKKKSKFAHVCDGVDYPTYRFFARPSKPRTPTVDRVPLPNANDLRGL